MGIPKRTPLQVVLTIPFVLLISAVVSMVGWLSFRNGQEAVNQVVNQLRREISDRIADRLHTYLDQPHTVNKINANAVSQTQKPVIEFHLWQQIQLFSSLSATFYGTTQGEQFSARRDRFGDYSVASKKAVGKYDRYAVNAQGVRTNLISSIIDFDPRLRPWYKAALTAKRPTWSKIYADIVTKNLAITATEPIYDRQGKLQGVVGSDLMLGEMNRFLSKIQIGKTGKTFIVERSGELVSTSTLDQVFVSKGNQIERIKAADSVSELVRAATQHLYSQFGDLDKIRAVQTLEFQLRGKKQFLQVLPFSDRNQVNWLIVVVLPEVDFMEQINANTQLTILFSAIALAISWGISILISRWISQPILKLNQAAKDLAQGNWSEITQSDQVSNRVEELAELAQSFRQMTVKLKESFSTLKEQNELMEKLNEALSESGLRLSQFLETIPVGVLVSDANGRVCYTNPSTQQMLGNIPQNIVLTTLFEGVASIYFPDSNIPYPPSQQPILQALRGKNAVVDEMEVRLSEGNICLEVWSNPIYNSDGEIVYAIAAFANITERKQAQQLMATYSRDLEFQVEQRTQDLSAALVDLHSAQAGLIQSEKMAALGQLIAGIAHEINTPLGAIASAIQHIQAFLQTDLTELLRFSQQLEGDRRETMFALIKIALNQPQSRSTRELRQIRKQMSETLGAHQIENANAIASLLVGIGLDQNLEPFLEFLPQLNQQNVLAKVYQVANLRTSAQTIAIATERSAKVAFALKSYSHYQNNDQKTVIQIIDNIETVLTLYQNQLNQGITILRKYDPAISTIFCYGDELTQVWTNIIHNAIQAMTNQGILEIETQLYENQILVKISDSGAGIPPEIQVKIFQPFFTTKPAGEGSGLGLDIVKRIIEKHEGTITVESVPGKTTFSIILPLGAIAEI